MSARPPNFAKTMTNKITPEENKTQMITEAVLILSSVQFLEKEINKNLSLMEEAINNHLPKEAEQYHRNVLSLLKKINLENDNMTDFMVKYRRRS